MSEIVDQSYRKSVLEELINFERTIDYLKRELSKFEWDSDEELVVIRSIQLKDILNRFIEGKVSDIEVTEWANLIEMREDIGLDPSKEDELKELIFELANPEITNVLTVDRAHELLETI